MALQRSTDLNETSYENPQHDGSEIEMSHIAGNIYDSLEGRDRESHVYSTTGEAIATSKTGTHNVDSKAQPNNKAKRIRAFSCIKVELPICQVAIAIIIVCTLICTISGFIVHTVINATIAEIEQHTSQNHKAIHDTLETMQEHQNTSDMASLDYQANNDRRLATLDNMVETVQETVETVQETVETVQGTIETVQGTIETVQGTIETVQENQNASKMASNNYHANNDRHLAILDNVIQTVQERQTISGQQVAFTARGATGKSVNGVLTFKYMDLNVGDAYDQTTGRFRCPVAGTYLFSATLISVYTRSSVTYCWIRKNAKPTVLVYSQEGVHDSASGSVLLHLSVGDLVDLGGCANANLINTNSGDASFIGSLIQAD